MLWINKVLETRNTIEFIYVHLKDFTMDLCVKAFYVKICGVSDKSIQFIRKKGGKGCIESLQELTVGPPKNGEKC